MDDGAGCRSALDTATDTCRRNQPEANDGDENEEGDLGCLSRRSSQDLATWLSCPMI